MYPSKITQKIYLHWPFNMSMNENGHRVGKDSASIVFIRFKKFMPRASAIERSLA